MSRIPLLDDDEAAPAGKTLFEEVASSRGSVGNLWRALAHSPELGRRVAQVGEQVRYQSLLPPDLRELAILTVARRTGCAYEWSQHAAIGIESGLPEFALHSIEHDEIPAGLTPEQVIVYRYADQLCRTAHVSEDVYHEAERLLTTVTLVELTVTIGYYTLLAYVLNGFQVELDPDAGPRPEFG